MNCKVKANRVGALTCAWGTDGCIAKHPNVSDRKLKWTAEQLVAIEGYKTRIMNEHRSELQRVKIEAREEGYARGVEYVRESLADLLGLARLRDLEDRGHS